MTVRELIARLLQTPNLDGPVELFVGHDEDNGMIYSDFRVLDHDDTELGEDGVCIEVIDDTLEYTDNDEDDDAFIDMDAIDEAVSNQVWNVEEHPVNVVPLNRNK